MGEFTSTPPRRRVIKTGWIISLAIHGVIMGLLAWFAAREGMLGGPLKNITVSLLPPPEPPKPPEPEPPKAEPVTENSQSQPAVVPPKAAILEKVVSAPADPVAMVVAPAPVEMPSLVFDDGSPTVQTEKDPTALFRSFVEFSLRSRWNRPADIADARYVAEVEIAVDATGRISDPRWKRKANDARWDASVMNAIAQTKTLGRMPPAGFPARLTVRFDVVPSKELNLE